MKTAKMTIDDKEFTLCAGTAAWAELEEQYGGNAGNMYAEVKGGKYPIKMLQNMVCAFVHCGEMYEGKKDLTPREWIISRMDIKQMEAMREVCNSLFESA